MPVQVDVFKTLQPILSMAMQMEQLRRVRSEEVLSAMQNSFGLFQRGMEAMLKDPEMGLSMVEMAQSTLGSIRRSPYFPQEFAPMADYMLSPHFRDLMRKRYDLGKQLFEASQLEAELKTRVLTQQAVQIEYQDRLIKLFENDEFRSFYSNELSKLAKAKDFSGVIDMIKRISDHADSIVPGAGIAFFSQFRNTMLDLAKDAIRLNRENQLRSLQIYDQHLRTRLYTANWYFSQRNNGVPHEILRNFIPRDMEEALSSYEPPAPDISKLSKNDLDLMNKAVNLVNKGLPIDAAVQTLPEHLRPYFLQYAKNKMALDEQTRQFLGGLGSGNSGEVIQKMLDFKDKLLKDALGNPKTADDAAGSLVKLDPPTVFKRISNRVDSITKYLGNNVLPKRLREAFVQAGIEDIGGFRGQALGFIGAGNALGLTIRAMDIKHLKGKGADASGISTLIGAHMTTLLEGMGRYIDERLKESKLSFENPSDWARLYSDMPPILKATVDALFREWFGENVPKADMFKAQFVVALWHGLRGEDFVGNKMGDDALPKMNFQDVFSSSPMVISLIKSLSLAGREIRSKDDLRTQGMFGVSGTKALAEFLKRYYNISVAPAVIARNASSISSSFLSSNADNVRTAANVYLDKVRFALSQMDDLSQLIARMSEHDVGDDEAIAKYIELMIEALAEDKIIGVGTNLTPGPPPIKEPTIPTHGIFAKE